MNTWTCGDCGHSVHRNPEDPATEEWTEQFIGFHADLHARQLAEHDGDRKSLQNMLLFPALHTGVAWLKRHEKGEK